MPRPRTRWRNTTDKTNSKHEISNFETNSNIAFWLFEFVSNFGASNFGFNHHSPGKSQEKSGWVNGWTVTFPGWSEFARKIWRAGGRERLEEIRDLGKLSARERIEKLVDPGSFEEIGSLVRDGKPSLRRPEKAQPGGRGGHGPRQRRRSNSGRLCPGFFGDVRFPGRPGGLETERPDQDGRADGDPPDRFDRLGRGTPQPEGRGFRVERPGRAAADYLPVLGDHSPDHPAPGTLHRGHGRPARSGRFPDHEPGYGLSLAGG